MARSVDAALRGRGIEGGEALRVERALALAMERRTAALDDDHHPAYLHPGRSVLVLLHDAHDVDADALVLAALHESADLELCAAPEAIRSLLGDDLADALADLPLPGDDTLEERLVGLPRAAALAVLAERLDHLRHLHLRPDLAASREESHREVERAWQPFAARVDERLAVRYGHWSRTFARRLRRDQFPRV